MTNHITGPFSSKWQELPESEREQELSSLQSASSPFENLNRAKAMAHLFLDDQIRGSKIEGSVLSSLKPLLDHALPLLKEKNVLSNEQLSALNKELKSYFKYAQKIDHFNFNQFFKLRQQTPISLIQELAQDIKEKVINLSSGDSLLIPGGYQGSPGHAMAYKIIREENFYKIIVINTGEDGRFHLRELQERKAKRAPYLVFSNIPKEKLFPGGSNLFLESLITPCVKAFEKVNYNPGKIYFASFKELMPYLSFKEPESKVFITGQRSGTCTWKVLLAVLRLNLPLPVYKRVHFHLRLSTLISFFRMEKEKNKWTLEKVAMYETAWEKTCYEANKKLREKLIEEKDVEPLLELEQDLTSILATKKRELGGLQAARLEGKTLTNPDSFAPRPESAEQLRAFLRSIRSSGFRKQKIRWEAPHFFKETPSSEQLQSQLVKIHSFLTKQFDEKKYSFYENLIDNFVREIPINTNFWESVPAKDRKAVITAANKLLFQYHRISISRNAQSTPTRLITAVTLLIVIYELCKLENESLFQHGDLQIIPFDLLEFLDKNPYILPSCSRDRKKYEELIDYYYQLRGIYFKPFAFSSLQKGENIPAKGEALFLKNLIEQYPALDNELQRYCNNFLKNDDEPNVDEAVKAAYLAVHHTLLDRSCYKNSYDFIQANHLAYSFVKPHDDVAYFTREASFPSYTRIWEAADGFISFKPVRELSYGAFKSLFRSSYPRLPHKLRDFKERLFKDANFRPRHTRSSMQTEVYPLEDYPNRESSTFSYLVSLMSSASAERGVQIEELLSHFEEYISYFSDTSLQTQFWLQFFKVPLHTRKTESSSFERQIEQNPSLVTALADFLRRGFTHFLEGSSFPDIPSGCFFMRVAIYSAEILEKSHLPIDRKPLFQILKDIKKRYFCQIDKAITRFDYTKEEKAIFYLHRLYFHLVASPIIEEEIDHKEILADYMAVKQLPISEEHSMRFLLSGISPFIQQYLSNIHQNNELPWMEIIPAIFRRSGISIQGKLKRITPQEKDNYLILHAENEAGDTYSLHLTDGILRINDQILSIADSFEYTHSNFVYLFGKDFRPVVHASRSWYYFSHPQFGEIHVEGHNLTDGLQIVIEGKRHYFIPPEKFKTYEGCFPKAIANYNHFFWHPVKTAGEVADSIIITHRDAPTKVIYTLGRDGQIRRDSQSFFSDIDEVSDLSIFDNTKHRLLRTDEQNQLTRIDLPRVESPEGHGLRFTRKKEQNDWSWDENYRLLPRKTVGYLGGTFDQYLEVEHKITKQRRILLPLTNFEKRFHPFSSKRKLVFEDSRSKLFSPEGVEKRTFISLPVKGGKITADNLLGHIFLAYIYMGIREFKKASRELDYLSEADNYTKRDLVWLAKVVHYPEDFGNYIPDTIAISLKAALIYASIQYKSNNNRKSPDFYNKLLPIYLQYQQRIATISPPFLLEEQEELFLLDELLNFLRSSSNLSGEEKQCCMQLEMRRDYLRSEAISTISTMPLPSNPLQSTNWLINEFYASRVKKSKNSSEDCQMDASLLLDSFNTKDSHHVDIQRRTLFHYGVRKILDGPEEVLKHGGCESKRVQSLAKLRFVVNFQLASSPFKHSPQKDFALHCLLHLLDFSHQNTNDLQNFKSSIKTFLAHLEDYDKGKVDSRTLKNSFKSLIDFVKNIPDYREEVAKKLVDFKEPVKRSPPKREPHKEKPIPFYPVDLAPLDDFTDWVSSFSSQWRKSAISYVDQKEQIENLTKRSRIFNEQFVATTYDNAVTEELKSLIQEIQKGEESLPKERVIVPRDVAQTMSDKLKGKLKSHKQEKEKLAARILEKVNNPGEDTKKRLAVLGGRKPPLTMEDMELLFLQKDLHACKKAFIASLSDKEIEETLKEVANWEVMEIAHLRMSQSQKLLESLAEEIDDEKRTILSEKLHSYTSQSLSHLKTSKYNHAFLVFARRSEKIPREDQAANVQRVSPENLSCIFHAIMGSGKTSVIAALWAFLQAMSGKQPIFFGDKALMKVVIAALKHSQLTAFGQKVYSMDYSREDIHPNIGGNTRLQWILDRLQKGKRKKELLILQPNFLQMLSLETKIAFKDHALEPDPEKAERLELLLSILSFFEKESVGLGDEIHRLLRSNHEVNFPLGEPQQLPPKRIELVRNLFLILVKKFDNELQLTSGKQTLVSETQWKRILPQIAKELFSIPSIHLEEKHEEAFIHFVSGSFDPNDHKEFVRELHRHADSENESDREKVEQIALVKHLLEELLPRAFTKSMNRHYGRSRKGSPGKIIPYIATDTPATTQFGNPIEALVLHFLAALSQGVSTKQVEAVIGHLIASAKQRSKGKAMERSPEGRFLRKITGLDISSLQTSRGLSKAVERINKNILFRLLIESETAALYATFHPNHTSSTPQDFCARLERLYGMTGTPWNTDGFPKKISGENVHWDEGSRGKIVHTMLNRAQETLVHSGNPDKITETLSSLFDKKEEPFDAIFDSGALFKNFSNEEVAKALLEVSQDKGSNKKHVIFFHKIEGETECNRLAALTKKGDRYTITFLPSSSKEDIESQGINLKECLFHLDDIHTTGVDLPLPQKTRAVVTIDENISLRALLQTIMRERQYLTSQRVDFLLSDDLMKKIHPEEKDSLDLLLLILQLAATNQAREKADSILRSYVQKLHEVFKTEFLNSLQRNESCRSGEAATLKMEVYREFLFPELNIDLASLILSEDKKVSAIEKLTALKEHLEKRFEEKIEEIKTSDSFSPEDFEASKLEDEYKNITKRLNDILEEATAKKDLFPSQVSQRVSSKEGVLAEDSIGLELENEQEIEQEEEQEQEVELERELEIELKKYTVGRHLRDRAETLWTKKEIEAFFTNFSHSRNEALKKCKMISLSDLFLQPIPQLGREHKEKYQRFSEIFSKKIIVTNNFCYVKEELLPVFFQGQRLANQLLLIEIEDDFACILLSEKESVSFKHFLTEEYKKGNYQNIWLISGNAKTYANNPTPLPVRNRRLRKKLAEVAIFTGNISAINSLQLENEGRVWLKDQSQRKAKIKMDYLKMRVHHKPPEKLALISSNLLKSKDYEGIGKYISLCYEGEKRAENITAERIKEIQECRSEDDIFLLSDEEIRYVHPDAVPLLSFDQLSLLAEKEQIQRIPVQHIDEVTPQQAKHLDKQQVLHVKKIDLIRALSPEVLNNIATESNKERMSYFAPRLAPSQLIELSEKLWIDCLPNRVLSQLSESMQKEVKAARIQKIPTTDVSNLSDLLLMKASVDQLNGVTPERIKEISHEDLIHRLEPPNLNQISTSQLEKLTDRQIPKLSDEKLINTLPYTKYKFLTEKQINQLTEEKLEKLMVSKNDEKEILLDLIKKNNQLIQKMTQNQLPGLISSIISWDNHSAIFAHISEKQLKNLSPQSVKNLPIGFLDRLPSSQFAFLSENQLLQMKGKILQKLPKSKIKHLEEGQLTDLTEEQLAHLTKEQVANIQDPNLLQRLPQTAIQQLAVEKLHLLTNDQLSYLSQSQTREIKDIELLHRLPSYRHLSKEQIVSLKEPAAIQKVESFQIKDLTQEQIRHLSDQQLAHLTKKQIQEIEDKELIQRVPVNSLPHIQARQITLLSDEQLVHIHETTIQQVALNIIPNLIGSFSKVQKDGLTVEQIQSLSHKDKIQLLTRANIKHLAARQLVHLSSDQLVHASFMQRIVRLFFLCLLPIFHSIGAIFSCCHT